MVLRSLELSDAEALFAAHGDELLDALEQVEGGVAVDLLLVGIDGFTDLASVGVKEPLSALAGRSGTALVAPVDLLGHRGRLRVLMTCRY